MSSSPTSERRQSIFCVWQRVPTEASFQKQLRDFEYFSIPQLDGMCALRIALYVEPFIGLKTAHPVVDGRLTVRFHYEREKSC
jgi:hypothetical protein